MKASHPKGHIAVSKFQIICIEFLSCTLSQIAVTTRILWPLTVLGIPGQRQTLEATHSSVCALGTDEGSGSVSDMLHFTPLAWVRNYNIPVSFFCLPSSPSVWGEKNVYQRQMLSGGRDKKCQVSKCWSEKDVCWKSWPWPHEKERWGTREIKKEKLNNGTLVLEVVWSDYWVWDGKICSFWLMDSKNLKLYCSFAFANSALSLIVWFSPLPVEMKATYLFHCRKLCSTTNRLFQLNSSELQWLLHVQTCVYVWYNCNF